ncbi:GMC oxidoreductase-domain-containing protein [Mycena rebaudengoi]|nr:GMC oxidoreductase-domain-containing protein [Mycena rebaudengoi]
MTSTFDFVIVGGGTAGLALAARLAEDTSVTVCVLEVGKDFAENEDVKVPGNYMTNIGKEFDGGLFSIPQEHVGNRAIYNPRGEGLGGSSLLNWLQLIRAPSSQYDSFESTLGAKGWNGIEFDKYFKKSQNLPQDQPYFKSNYALTPEPALYGDGPIVNAVPRFVPAINEYYYKACAELGVPFNPVGGNGDNSGVWPALSAIDSKAATRVSSTAYLQSGQGKPNLTIISRARATRVLFKHPATVPAVATAVVYTLESSEQRPGETEMTVEAKKEVILCAGTFRTPQLLEMSGIGDTAHIQKGIERIVDLPGVGNNLRGFHSLWPPYATSHTFPEEHLSTLVLCETDPSIESYDITMNPNPDLVALSKHKEEYKTRKSGIFSAVPLSFSYVPLKTFMSQEKISEIKAMVAAASTSTTSIKSRSSIELLQKWMDDENAYQLEFIMVPHHVPFLPNGEFNSEKMYCFFSVIVDHPFSRGSVHTDPSNPAGNPIIDLGMFENDIDREITVEGIKFIQKLIQHPSLRDDAGVRAISPGPAIKSDEDIKEYINQASYTSCHPIGTASMLPRQECGVVDHDLLVYGTANLRITVYAIAEKAADIIKAAWKGQPGA